VSNLLKKEKGFTLIEIVLVLAIAGLLLVIVFLAVSGAQRNRRDTQRKTDLSRIAAQIEAFASNNNGCYPDSGGLGGCPATIPTFATFVSSTYITGSNLNDPLQGGGYSYTGLVTPSTATAAGVQYQIGAGTTCDGAANTSGRVYAVRMGLEQGTGCRDNK
jgi:prepilin-type N-terminal cleavage/methylation domain-containing protein